MSDLIERDALAAEFMRREKMYGQAGAHDTSSTIHLCRVIAEGQPTVGVLDRDSDRMLKILNILDDTADLSESQNLPMQLTPTVYRETIRPILIDAAVKYGRWVPTDQRLPKDRQWVLVSDDRYKRPMEARYIAAAREFHYRDLRGTIVSGDADVIGEGFLHIRAWMPLPELPEGGRA